ncbi:hypothetical protein [Roseibium sp. SCP14]|uniref:hypothetical protein n=1 Tax=Roseibium sp. SCP14 TaxID=3141375 RepID=UPI003334E16E
MSADFLLGVFQTAIGSGLGFGLGIIAFHYQQERQAEIKKSDDWKQALDALNRLNIAAGSNIEALANTKLQFVNDMRPEIEAMKAAVNNVYGSPSADRSERTRELHRLSETMRYFHMSLQKTSVMVPPDTLEYSALIREMPALPLFVHRAMGMMQELNERITSRNVLIHEHAREGGTGAGMNAERVVYFAAMLADEGIAICEHVDFALYFWMLVREQVAAYMSKKAKGEDFVQYQLLPRAEEAMPNEDLFPLMRGQLVTFEDT